MKVAMLWVACLMCTLALVGCGGESGQSTAPEGAGKETAADPMKAMEAAKVTPPQNKP